MNKNLKHISVFALFLFIIYCGIMLFNYEGWIGILLIIVDILALSGYVKKKFLNKL